VKLSGDEKQRSLASRIADLAFHCLWMAYVIEVPAPSVPDVGAGRVLYRESSSYLAPVWHTFYVAFWFLLLFNSVSRSQTSLRPSGAGESR